MGGLPASDKVSPGAIAGEERRGWRWLTVDDSSNRPGQAPEYLIYFENFYTRLFCDPPFCPFPAWNTFPLFMCKFNYTGFPPKNLHLSHLSSSCIQKIFISFQGSPFIAKFTDMAAPGLCVDPHANSWTKFCNLGARFPTLGMNISSHLKGDPQAHRLEI